MRGHRFAHACCPATSRHAPQRERAPRQWAPPSASDLEAAAAATTEAAATEGGRGGSGRYRSSRGGNTVAAAGATIGTATADAQAGPTTRRRKRRGVSARLATLSSSAAAEAGQSAQLVAVRRHEPQPRRQLRHDTCRTSGGRGGSLSCSARLDGSAGAGEAGAASGGRQATRARAGTERPPEGARGGDAARTVVAHPRGTDSTAGSRCRRCTAGSQPAQGASFANMAGWRPKKILNAHGRLGAPKTCTAGWLTRHVHGRRAALARPAGCPSTPRHCCLALSEPVSGLSGRSRQAGCSSAVCAVSAVSAVWLSGLSGLCNTYDGLPK